MILEGLVTTRAADGSPHLAPMGPRVSADFARLTLRPFPTSGTYRNLLAHPEGVLHVTDDALLIARAALGAAELPPVRPAAMVSGFVLADCCRHYEFVVKSIDSSGERVTIEAEVVHAERHRDFWGFNRAKHAVVEAAILATRFHLLPRDEVAAEFKKLRVIVGKTGGPAEHAAMDFLEARLRAFLTSDTGPAGMVPGQSVGTSPPFPPREGGPGGLGGSELGSPGGRANVVNPSPQPPPPGGEGVPAQQTLPSRGSGEPDVGESVGTSPPFPLREGGPGGLGASARRPAPTGADAETPPPGPLPQGGRGCPGNAPSCDSAEPDCDLGLLPEAPP